MTAFAAAGERLERAVRERVTPGLVLEIGGRDTVRVRTAIGRLTYAPDAAEVTADTIYDLASLTKIIATASIAMQLVDRGAIAVDTPIAAIEPRWTRGGTLRHLLDHSSGLPAHVPLYKTATSRDAFLEAILETPLERPPGVASVYSDLGFILLGFLLERAGGAALDTAFAPIAARLGEIGFNPAAALHGRVAPTEVDSWRSRELRGEVHDENAFVLGGVAGHAGLFGTAAAVGAFARAILETLHLDTWLARRQTLERFTTPSSVPGSSRALGWDTMLPTSSCGRLMSARAIGHTGFSGTSLWIDPARDLYIVLLTNRVHPSREGSGIQELRRDVADLVVSALAG